MPLSDNLILDLVGLGFIGLAALIFVMMFVLLIRNQKTTPENAQLRKNFLMFGVVVIVLAALVQVLPLFVGSRSAEIVLSFSPDFAANDLPAPTLRMGDQPLEINTRYSITGEKTVVIIVDEVLKTVRELTAKTESLTALSTNLAGSVRKLANDLEQPQANRAWTAQRARRLGQSVGELERYMQMDDLTNARGVCDEIANQVKDPRAAE